MSFGDQVPLGDVIVEECSGASIKKDEFTKVGVPVVPKKAISESLQLDDTTFGYTSNEFSSQNANAKIQRGHYVTTLRNLNPDGSTLGLICENSSDEELVLAQGLFGFTFKGGVDPRYICYVSRIPAFREAIQRIKVGSTQVHIRAREFKEIKIPLPPLEEQRRIAAILDKADAIRRKRQQAIELTETFLRSVFLDMFGDPVTNPKGWPKTPLGELCTIRRGASPRPISEFLGGSVPWIKIGDGSKGDPIYLANTKEKVTEAGSKKSVYLEPGSLIFANCGVSLGFARILKVGGCIHDGWLSFENIDKSLEKIFLLKLLNFVTDHFRKIAPDGTQPNLNTGIMKSFEITVPPLEMQQEYLALLESISMSKAHMVESEEQAEKFFQSVSQKAFKGELTSSADLKEALSA